MSRTRSLSAVAGPVARRALGKRFAALGALLEDWPHIVGAALADRAVPEKLDFPRGRRDGGVLCVRAAPADALELQHDTPRILERLNGHFGYRAVDRIRLIQAPVSTRPMPVAGRPRIATPAESAAMEKALDIVEDPALRSRLARLADALLGRGGGE